jgi:hypothetical protein
LSATAQCLTRGRHRRENRYFAAFSGFRPKIAVAQNPLMGDRFKAKIAADAGRATSLTRKRD